MDDTSQPQKFFAGEFRHAIDEKHRITIPSRWRGDGREDLSKMINALLFERPIWFMTGPLEVEEAAEAMEDFTYHRPVLVSESVELLAPRAGALVVDGTCGGGGHTAEILRAGADVVGL